MSGSPRWADLDDGLDREVPVPSDRVRDEDRPHHRVQGSEAQSRVGPGQDGPRDLRDRRRHGPQDEAKDDDTLHASARRLPDPPPRTHEEQDAGEHPGAEERRQIRVRRRDAGARPERVRRHAGDEQVRRGDQVGPEDEWSIDGGKGPRSAEPGAPGRIRQGKVVQRRRDEDDPYPRYARPEEQRIRRCPGGERSLDDLPEIPDDEGEHDEERGPVRGTPRVQAEDVRAEERAHDEGGERQGCAEREDELTWGTSGHSDTISKTARSTRSG